MRISRDSLLNVATATIALTAVTVFVNDRIRPAIAEHARLDPGESLGKPLLLRTISTGDTIPLTGADPTLVIVFQSTCDVCERVAPEWRRIAQSIGARLLALGLESDSAAVVWLNRRIPMAEPVTAIELSILLDRFRIRAVPTTLLLAEGQLQLVRIGPLQTGDLIAIDQAFAATRKGSAAELH